MPPVPGTPASLRHPFVTNERCYNVRHLHSVGTLITGIVHTRFPTTTTWCTKLIENSKNEGIEEGQGK